jgi:uncharacterized repeat protein (TIGR01451 family)
VIVLATPRGGADVSVSVGASPANPGVASVVTFTVTATNLGPSVATDVQVSSALPLGYLFQSAAPSQGLYNAVTGSWSIGTLITSASATLTLRGLVLPLGPYAVTATRTASTPADPNAGNDSASAGVTPVVLVVTSEGPRDGED